MNSVTIELPPWLTNGSGMPVTGKRLTFTATLINVCIRISMTMPTATNWPAVSPAICATRTPRISKKMKSANSPIAPRNPSSSPSTLKIKSLVGTFR